MEYLNKPYKEEEVLYFNSMEKKLPKPSEASPLEYKVAPNIDYEFPKDDFLRHIPSLPIIYMRPEQMGSALGMIYLDSNYIILRDTLQSHPGKKLEVEVHESKHWMDKNNPERYIREHTRNMFTETYFH